MSGSGKKKGASVIPLRPRREAGEGKFDNMPLAKKVAHLREKTARERAEMILGDPDGKRLARSLQPQELYLLVKEKGEADALPLIEFSSPEQCRFFLDMELWEKWTFSDKKAMEWLEHLMKTGEERVVEQLSQMDFELILLICKKEFFVGGGIGDLLSEEERSTEWDHSFDNIFFITYRDKQHEQLLGRFLDIVYRNDRDLYLNLMEGVKNEIESEMEELAFRFRTGRLADLGFPDQEEALSIYRYLDPELFVPAEDKAGVSLEADSRLTVPLPPGDSLFSRAMAIAASEELSAELNYLINAVLVAEDAPFADRDAMDAILRRVSGYINIALERLSLGDVEKAACILNSEYLKRLFQLGYSILFGLRKRALNLAPQTENHAVNRALLGFGRKCPQFYRGLDPDHIDGFREFSDMGDVRAADLFLQQLEDAGNSGC
jgi:hypothetical protein